MKKVTRRIIRLGELSFEVCLERRSKRDSSSRGIIRLAPVSILETRNQTNYKCFPKFVQTYNASSVQKQPILILGTQRLVTQECTEVTLYPRVHVDARLQREKGGLVTQLNTC